MASMCHSGPSNQTCCATTLRELINPGPSYDYNHTTQPCDNYHAILEYWPDANTLPRDPSVKNSC